MHYELVEIRRLLPLERVFPHHLDNLREMILKDGVITHPLEIDKDYGIVLDGSHRYALLKEGYELAPVHWVDYQSPHVRVGTHRIHRLLVTSPIELTKQEVVRRGVLGDLLPPRTTRHFFPFLREEIRVPLEDLRPRKEKENIQYLIAKVTLEEEIANNEHYIQELDEEAVELKNYSIENQRTRDYLLKQIEEMRK